MLTLLLTSKSEVCWNKKFSAIYNFEPWRHCNMDIVTQSIISFTLSIKNVTLKPSPDMRDDNHPFFLRHFYRALRVICTDMFFGRASSSPLANISLDAPARFHVRIMFKTVISLITELIYHIYLTILTSRGLPNLRLTPATRGSMPCPWAGPSRRSTT